MIDEKDVKSESSPESALESAVASSPEVKEQAQQQVQEAQTETAEQSVTQETEEEQRIPYSRFKEKVDEANWYKQQLEQTIQQRQAQQPLSDKLPEELGNTPEEREFWRLQRKIAREEAEKVTKAQLGQINPLLEAGARRIANMEVQEFRKSHPDIKPNSSEEIAIAQKISEASRVGYNLTADEAYWQVMGQKGIRTAQQQGKQQVKQQMEAKKQANVENQSIPSTSTSYNPKEKLTLRQRLEKNLSDIETGKL